MPGVPHRRAFLERLEGSEPRVVSKHPLTHERVRQFIGRDHPTVVKLQHPAVARKHVLLEFGPLGRWWLDDMGSPRGTWINRTHYAGVRRLLEPLDLIRFEGGEQGDVVFRFGVEGWTAKDAPLRSLIDLAPEDPARWEVWADFLEEQGDPLSQRIRGFGPSPGDVGVTSGHRWEHGFIARGILQRGGRVLASLQTELKVLLGNPFSRWMRALHVDFVSYADGAQLEALEAEQVLQILEREQPPALRVLTFQLSRFPNGVRLHEQFLALQRALPKLQSDFETLLNGSSP